MWFVLIKGVMYLLHYCYSSNNGYCYVYDDVRQSVRDIKWLMTRKYSKTNSFNKHTTDKLLASQGLMANLLASSYPLSHPADTEPREHSCILLDAWLSSPATWWLELDCWFYYICGELMRSIRLCHTYHLPSMCGWGGSFQWVRYDSDLLHYRESFGFVLI